MDYDALAIRFGRIARHLIVREDDESKCHPRPDIDLCEKPASADKSTPITIGVIVGIVVVGTLAVLTFFHFRRKRQDEKEWPKNNQELEDYGFTVPSSTTRQSPPQQRQHQQQQQQDRYQQDQYQHRDTPQNVHHDAGLASQNPARGSLDNLERSLRGGQTTSAFSRQEEHISANTKPAEPADRI
ncbi:hypothetical protein F5X97DRAFT_301157 [Nemania serpens]|nr:hypothetical protein F5X97DRAFT_301157 [Nemania serpens]